MFLAYEAYISLDAVVRTLVRVLWTKKRLLEWKTASSVEQRRQADLAGFFQAMWFAPAVAGAAMLLVTVYRPELLASVVLPLAGLWFRLAGGRLVVEPAARSASDSLVERAASVP